ncbi:MAG TPA: PIN domain-containing protein [Dehalococcoidia bacterium]|nr:PIN domain-containing protein [Dehalococcoidia bacterium]
MRFLDADIFIRALTGDDPPKAAACERLFRELAAGRAEATTSEAVLAEIVFVLASPRHYGFERAKIARALAPYVSLRGLRVPERPVVARALALYEATRLDFEDCLTVAKFESGMVDAIVSHDRGFDRIAGVVRVEPA